MKKNVGSIDRIIRIIIVLTALYFAYKFNFTDWKSYALSIFSFFMTYTIVTKSCPLYYIFNMSSIKIDI